jgi:gamma-aminobutyric acid type B receptor
MGLIKFLLLWAIVQAVSNGQESGEKETGQRDINFLLLLSFEIEGPTSQQPLYADGPMIQPGIELAVEQINQREDLLAGYSVNLTVANSACNLLGYTAIGFVTNLFHGGVMYAGIVGPTCSESVELVSPITGQEGVSLINFHIASSHQFTDRSRYRYSFSTVSSTSPVIGLVVHLMKEKNWESVAVLYEQQTTVYLNAYNLLVEKLPQIYPNGRISFAAPVSEDILPLSSIVHQHLRVVIVLSTLRVARNIVCLIQKRHHQIYFPAYQFLFVGNYPSFHYPVSFTLNRHPYECSVEEMTQAMEGFLLTFLTLDVTNSTELVSGVTYSEYFQQYQERVNGSTTEWANPTYDGVWSLALALNNSIPRLNRK